MAFVDDYQTGNDPTFRQRSIVALTKAATQVIGEAKGVMTDAKLGKRHEYARLVLARPQEYAESIAFVLAAAGISPSATDTTLLNTIVSNWDKLAGVKSTD